MSGTRTELLAATLLAATLLRSAGGEVATGSRYSVDLGLNGSVSGEYRKLRDAHERTAARQRELDEEGAERGGRKLSPGDDPYDDAKAKIAALNYLANTLSFRRPAAPVAGTKDIRSDGTVEADLGRTLEPWQLEILFEDNPYDCTRTGFRPGQHRSPGQTSLDARNVGETYRRFGYDRMKLGTAHAPIPLGWLVARAMTNGVYQRLLNQRSRDNDLQSLLRNNHMDVRDGIAFRTDAFASDELRESLGQPPVSTLVAYLNDEPGANHSVISAGGKSRNIRHQLLRNPEGTLYSPKEKYHFWQTYDLRKNQGPGNASDVRDFLRFPIDAIFDAGEVIYPLPNQFKAYVLHDGNGKLLDEAVANVVVDNFHRKAALWKSSGLKSARDNDHTIINPFGCMRCHASGMLETKQGDDIDVRAEIERNIVDNEKIIRGATRDGRSGADDDDPRGIFVIDRDNRFRPLKLRRDFGRNVSLIAEPGDDINFFRFLRMGQTRQMVRRAYVDFKVHEQFRDDDNARFRKALKDAQADFPNPNDPSQQAPLLPDLFYSYQYDGLSLEQAALELRARPEDLVRLLGDADLRRALGLRGRALDPKTDRIPRSSFESFFCLTKFLLARDPQARSREVREDSHPAVPKDGGGSAAPADGKPTAGAAPRSSGKEGPRGEAHEPGAARPASGRPAARMPSPDPAPEYRPLGACGACHNPETDKRALRFDPENRELWARLRKEDPRNAALLLEDSIARVESGDMPRGAKGTRMSVKERKAMLRFFRSLESPTPEGVPDERK